MIRFAVCRALVAAAVSTCLIPVACADTPSEAEASTSIADSGGLSVQSHAVSRCPASVAVNKAVELRGSTQFRLTNEGGAERVVSVVEEITDSEGGRAERTDRLRIPPRGSVSDRSTPRAVLRATYSSPGTVVVTTTVTITDPDSGEVFVSSTNACSFVVE